MRRGVFKIMIKDQPNRNISALKFLQLMNNLKIYKETTDREGGKAEQPKIPS